MLNMRDGWRRIRHQDDCRGERGCLQIGVIHITMLRGISGALPLGEELGDGRALGCTGSDVIERELGVQSPTEDGKRKQQDRHANGEMTFAAAQIALFAVIHSCADILVYTSHFHWLDAAAHD